MFTARHIHSLAVGCALAWALLVFAMSGAAAAQASDVTQSAARAQERYYSSYGKPRPIDAGAAAARAQERYYSSFGEPEPLTQSPSPSDYPPLLAIALSIAITLVIVTACATHLRRLRVRRRRAAGVTT